MPAETKSRVQFRGQKTGKRLGSAKFQNGGKEESFFKEREMYPMRWPPYDNSDVENRINGVLGPLSLFAPFPHEDMHEEEPQMELERPVTPINDEIKCHPTSFDKLAAYIRRRISPRPDVPHLSKEDQQMLAGILMGEVTGVWPQIRQQIDDPFLSPEENRELNRRISVHIVTVCEQLFLHYLRKAEVLNSRGIFSGPANMSRLKAQLSLDANKFLNILTIRRYIVADMRGKDEDESQGSETLLFTREKSRTTIPAMTYQALIETSRPKSKTGKIRIKSPGQELRKIAANMPTLDTGKLHELIAQFPDRQIETPSQAASVTPPSRTPDRMVITSGASKETLSLEKVVLKRSNSLPEVHMGETLLEELGVDESVRVDKLERQEVEFLQRENLRQQQVAVEKESKSPRPGTIEYINNNLNRLLGAVHVHVLSVFVYQVAVEKESKSPRPGTIEYINNDLNRLLGRNKEEFKVEEDMPPLLQAITRNAKHDGQKEVLEKKLKELEEKERKEKEQQSIPLRGPKHPQPATVQAKLPNKMEVRASDIRVSERICMSSITLDRFATVYNDLIEEIDQPTVKMLDRNLFLGDEIREVYQEIMRTIPSQHLELDDDETVVPAAESVNMTGTMASASLVRKRSDRVINPAFVKEARRPPWGEMDHKAWVKTPNNPPKNFQGEDIFAPIKEFQRELEDLLSMTPNMDHIHEVIRNPSKMSQLVKSDNIPSFVQDKMARTYASWLQWWKSTITSDDYLKYLSTQETDYMGAVFHFYDSGEDEDEDDLGNPGTGYLATGTGYMGTGTHLSHKPSSRTTHSSKQAELREKEKKMEDLKVQKQEFQTGFWNVNTVLLGGLGKDPVIEEEEDDRSTRAPKSADTNKSAKTLKERAAARHSAKHDKSRPEISQSRASKVTSLTNLSKLDTDRSSVSGDAPLTPQDRLEKVWTSLEMPDSLKLDMAIKYSCNEFFIKLSEAIDRWEKVTDLILKREELLVKLEKFERSASDPNRFFEKGPKRSSVVRLKEAQQRSFYYKRIDVLDSEIKYELQYIRNNFRDNITYKGRPYTDKMKWDRTEMLHWLQEERKENAIRYEAMLKNIPLKTARLDPIPTPLPAPQRVA